MKLASLLALFLSPLLAQPAAEPPKPEAAAETKPVAPSPAVATESWLTGSVDVGYRWVTGPAGSFNTYRSVVDLGSGPKLLGTDFTILDPKHRLFDRIDVRAANWGDDPYTTLHVNAQKLRIYDFNADYRNIAYFNYLPSYADPLLSRGIILNERAYDTHNRISSFQLELLPGRTVVPYFAYNRSSGFGTGVTTFVSDANEYPVPNRISNALQDFHGGVRFEFRRLHFNLEEGGTWFKDDQQLFANGVHNTGNREGPIFAQNLFLTDLLQTYGVRSTGSYSKAAFTTNPVSWLDLSAQFLYTQPETNVNYQQNNTGSFVSLNQLLFYTGQQYLVSATAKLPRTSGNIGVEIRPFRRVRILESWLTDRLHTASSSDGRQTLLPATTPQPPETLQSARLVTNYSQQQVDLLVDVTRKLTLRGGYRYVWGDANTVILPVTGLTGFEAGKLRRNVGIAGVSFRPGSKLSVNAEFEGASSDATYFRTSLSNYQRVHARGQYQVMASLLIAADFGLLANQNPTAGPLYYYLARQASVSVHWTPKGTGFSVDGDYTRSTVKSDILYLVPQTLTPELSLYRDNAHLASALINIPLPNIHGLTPKLSAGGALVVSSGSRPTNYFQPLASLVLPVSKHVSWVSQWRYYGYAEPFYAYEDFRTHLITTGLKFTR